MMVFITHMHFGRYFYNVHNEHVISFDQRMNLAFLMIILYQILRTFCNLANQKCSLNIRIESLDHSCHISFILQFLHLTNT